MLLLLLGVRGKPRMYRSLLAYCTALLLNIPISHLRGAPVPTDTFCTPAAEAGTFQPPLLGAPTPTDAFCTLAAEAGTTMSGNRPVNSAKNVDFHVHLGIFYMPQICDMGPMALLPFRRKACLRIFLLLKIRRLRLGLNPRTWLPESEWVVNV
jgi:hypothetical protein